jgi:inner membrane protein
MDSLSQLALGAAVGVAVMGRRTAVWKAALWGGACGTLPDLDALIDFGDAVRNMTYHRAESHALFWLTLASAPLAWLVSRLHGDAKLFKRWWLATWLVLVTHPLLDTFTVYGTQLLLPFRDHPFGIGSVFIIDPLYTVPLLVGLFVALLLRQHRGLRWNAAGLALSTLYLGWSVAAQQHVEGVVKESLATTGIATDKVLVTPTPFNTVLWRVVVMRGDHYQEGFYSLLDRERKIRFDAFPNDVALYRQLRDEWAVARMAWFTKGFFALRERDGRAILTDLRMGQEPDYVFSFVLAQRQSPTFAAVPAESVGRRGDVGAGLAWVWTRLQGYDVPPPRS